MLMLMALCNLKVGDRCRHRDVCLPQPCELCYWSLHRHIKPVLICEPHAQPQTPGCHCRRVTAAKAAVTATAASKGKRSQDDVMRPQRTLLRGHTLPHMRFADNYHWLPTELPAPQDVPFASSVHLSSAMLIERLLHKDCRAAIENLLAVCIVLNVQQSVFQSC